MRQNKYMQNVLLGAAAVVIAGAHFVPGSDKQGPVLAAAAQFVSAKPSAADSAATAEAPSAVAVSTTAALGALSGSVRTLSHPQALEDAFKAYFEYKSAHPQDVK